jgi:hypothetical protein
LDEWIAGWRVQLRGFLLRKLFSGFLGLDSDCLTPFAKMSSQERHIMTNNEQLELGLNGGPARILGRRRETRMARGQWWFARMREAVENAMDWQNGGEPRSEQIWMPSANRELKA